MQLIKFEVYYGGFHSDNTFEVSLENGSLLYYRDRFFRNSDPGQINLEYGKLQNFLTASKPLIERWRRNYFSPICDGTQWSIEIVTDAIKMNHSGSNAYPHNFIDFLKLFRRFIGDPQFAKGHHKDQYLTWGELPPPEKHPYDVVSRYNLRTKHHLRKQKKTIRQLSEYLQMDYDYVCHQLRCIDTFEVTDLIKIAAFLGVPITDFLYEGGHDLPRRRIRNKDNSAAINFGSEFKWTAYDQLRTDLEAGIRVEKLKQFGLISTNLNWQRNNEGPAEKN